MALFICGVVVVAVLAACAAVYYACRAGQLELYWKYERDRAELYSAMLDEALEEEDEND